MAGDGGLYGDFVAGFDVLDFFADGFNGRGTFVADEIRVLDNLRADSAGCVIMDVAAADADDGDFKQDVVFVFDDGLRHVGNFHLPDARQDRCFHITSLINNNDGRL